MLPSFAAQCYESFVCLRLPEKLYKSENFKGAEGITCWLFILLCKLIGFSLELLIFQAEQCQKARERTSQEKCLSHNT